MQDKRSVEALIDSAEIDRELAAALDVAPSPEFLARVRMRIAGEPEPRFWHVPFAFAAVAGCAMSLLIVAAWIQLNQPGLPHDVVPAMAAAPFAGAPLGIAMSSVRRSQKPTPEMRAIMQSNAEARTALRAHANERDYDGIAADAATLEQNFAYVSAFWANQRVDDAIDISGKGLKAAVALQTAALAGDDVAIEQAMAMLTGTCETCHKDHREQLPDKTYAIRL